MKKNIVLLALLCIWNCVLADAKVEGKINICEGLDVQIPDYYVQVDMELEAEGLVYAGIGAHSSIMIKSGRGRGPIKAKEAFNLSNCFHVGSSGPGLFNTKDLYRYDYWTDDDNEKYVTYSGGTGRSWFCIFMNYQDKADIKYLEEIINSKDYHEKWWGRVRYYFRCSGVLLFIIGFFIMPIIIFITRKKLKNKYFTYFVSIATGLLLFGSHLGDVLVSIPYIGLVFLWGAMLHEVTVEQYLNAILGGEN